MFNLDEAMQVLRINGVSETAAEKIASELMRRQVCLGAQMYCVTRYDCSSAWEVVPAVVTRTHITNLQKCAPSYKSKKVFAVEGKYAPRGEYEWVYGYKANFNNTSIGKTIFFTLEEAQEVCDKKNKK